MISGFEEQTSGVIKIENQSVDMMEPYQRDVNTVFQIMLFSPI